MTKIRWIRDAGIALVITPTIMLCIPIYAALVEPKLLIDHWDFYWPWVGIPYAVGLALWAYSRRLDAQGR
jgi:hypothetical protein